MGKDFGLLQRAIRLYTFYTPIRKGKYRAALAGLGQGVPDRVLVKTKYGTELWIDPNDLSYRLVYFLGEYEPAISDIVVKLVRPGDICFDVGANIGWFSTLLAELVGESGEVHAFEPVPDTYESLCENSTVNGSTANLVLNNVALGDYDRNVTLHLFKDLPSGHASISDLGNSAVKTVSARMITADGYIEENGVDEASFVKLDVEGAELSMLKGGDRFFRQERPPMFVIEMALATSKAFGYAPNDLLEYIRGKGDFDFYLIDEKRFCLRPVDEFQKNDPGANVLCLPRGHYGDRIKRLGVE